MTIGTSTLPMNVSSKKRKWEWETSVLCQGHNCGHEVQALCFIHQLGEKGGLKGCIGHQKGCVQWHGTGLAM